MAARVKTTIMTARYDKQKDVPDLAEYLRRTSDISQNCIWIIFMLLC
jgi:hypothetical protein